MRTAPLTTDTWDDFSRLFGENGACAGCWCMYWRRQHREFETEKGFGNRREMRRIVESGVVPGLLGYAESEPIAWCSIEPRDSFPRLERSRILAPVDERPCWSIVCLFVARTHRRQGVSVAMLHAAVDYVRSRSGELVEAYPVDPPAGDPVPDAFAWTGLASAFRKAGFQEVVRRSGKRPVMRFEIAQPD